MAELDFAPLVPEPTTKPSWRNTAVTPPTSRLALPTTESGVNSLLYQWGLLQFQVHPLNIHEMDHETDTDWAKKEIAGAAIYREWVGENDETLYFRGRIFPYRIGGMGPLEIFEATRRAGVANMMLRGDGTVLGWYVCEKLVRAHTFLGAEGIGQQIAFEAIFARVPVPENQNYMSELWRAGYVGPQ